MSGTRRARPSPGAAITSSPWIIVAIGVIVMVVLLVVALGSVRGRRPYPDMPPPDPAMSLPGVPTGAASRPPTSAAAPVAPGLSPRSTVLPTRPAPSPSTRSGGSPRPVPPPPPSSPVTGRYAVVTRFETGFVGEVLIVNADSVARGWTVQVTFPDGRVADVWVDTKDGTANVAGGALTYRSGVDLAPGGSVRLRFRVEPGGTTRPDVCTVDGARCAGF